MQAKNDSHVFAGMQRDIDIAKHKPQYLYDAYNIRVTAREGDTFLALTNERGPLYRNSFSGKYVGHCVVDNSTLVLFLTESNVHSINGELSLSNASTLSGEDEGYPKVCDTIVKVDVDTNSYDILYVGNLNFDTEHPLECLYVYDSSSLRKIYWVDGKNSPRVINIDRVIFPSESNLINSTQFDFVQELSLNEEVTIKRNNTGGEFAPGVIQYAFSYYYLYGQESNLFYTTPLNYVAFYNRGGSPEEKVPCSFAIRIDNVDTKFDYLRIYSIHRTSLDAVPTVKLVKDIKINNQTSISYTDNGTTGEIFDNKALFYIGGESIVAGHIASNDNHLFLGELLLKRKTIRDLDLSSATVRAVQKQYSGLETNDSVLYSYFPEMQNVPPHFKTGEHYYMGVQFQHKTGVWSNVAPVKELNSVSGSPYYNPDTGVYRVPNIEIILPNSLLSSIANEGYVKVRGVCLFPNIEQRKIITQGLLCPTVYNYNSRKKNAPFAQSSWFFRPRLNDTIIENDFSDMCSRIGNNVEFRHNKALPNDWHSNAEIQGAKGYFDVNDSLEERDKEFAVDQAIITLHSPEVEFDEQFHNIPINQNSGITLNVMGITQISGNRGLVEMNTSTPSIEGTSVEEYKLVSQEGKMLIAGNIWRDAIFNPETHEAVDYGNQTYAKADFMIYPWHRTGSLNNDINREIDLTSGNSVTGQQTSILKNKKLINYRFSKENTAITPIAYNLNNIELFDVLNDELIKLKSYLEEDNITYLGTVDTVLNGSATIKGSYATGNYYFNPQVGRRVIEVGMNNEFTVPFVPKPQPSPVRMKYKSSTHLVLSLADNKILPRYTYNEDSTVITDTTEITNDTVQNNAVYIKFVVDGVPDEVHERVPMDDRGNPEQPSTDFESLEGLYLVDNSESNYHMRVFYAHASQAPVMDNEHTTFIGVDWNLEVQEVTLVPGDYYKTDDTLYVVNENRRLEESDEDYNGTGSSTTITMPTFLIGDQTDEEYEDSGIPKPYMFIGELVNSNPLTFDVDNDRWVPVSEPVAINWNGNTSIKCTHGDTWYQRYDCMKTLPYTQEDENSIIDILSFMCETRVNIDGRYDRNRNNLSTTLSGENFNKINNIYSNHNNYFSYIVFPEWYTDETYFPNQFTWTLEHLPNSQTDAWTNITLADTYSLEGVYGRLSAFASIRDKLLCFQDRAVNRIIFNPRIQISPSDAVPIEIASSQKMQGIEILSNKIGCSNKRSIIVIDDAIYFLDDNTHQFYEMKTGFSSISDLKGFNNWFKEKDNFSTERSFYDYINKDLYLVWNDQCLIYNTNIAEFTSFMSYEDVPSMFNIGNNFYCLNWYYNTHTGLDDNCTNLYRMFSGDYNRFFGILQPVYISFISAQEGTLDKIFTNVESRIDVWAHNELVHNRHFDYIRVYNEYQDTGEVPIKTNSISDIYRTSARKKFRIWRTNIPRNRNSLDRIRNTWANIKLGFAPKIAPANKIANLDNTENPNMALYYEQLAGSNINEANLEHSYLSGNIDVTEDMSDYTTMKFLIHDVNVKYFI